MTEQFQSANDFDKKEEASKEEKKEKKLSKRFRTSSANLYSKKNRKQNVSPTKSTNNQNNKGAKIPHQRSLSAKKPGLPVIFSEQRVNTNSLMPISALCWTVTDAVSGQIIYSKMSSEVREMASLTKMMTLYVCYQLSVAYNLNAESEEIIVPKIAAYTCGTSAFLREYEKLSLQDLYYALMLPSGNDAAVTLAHHFGQLLTKNPLQLIKIRQQINSTQLNQIQNQQQQQYSTSQKQSSPERDMSPFKKNINEDNKQQNEIINTDQQQNISQYQQTDQKKKSQYFISRFVKEMNKYAQKIGMRGSQFSNCHGLASKSNRSNCEDLSKVAMNIIQTPYLQQICSTKNYQCIIYHTIKKDIRKAEWVNTNKLLWDETDSFKGVKTGCTDNAGPCLCVYYKDPVNVNIELIVTVLCCKNPERRFEDSSNLAKWAARQLKQCQIPQQLQQQSTQNQNKYPFYNPQNTNQRNLLSRSNVFQVKNKNEFSTDRINPQLDQVQSPEKVYQLGRTINSFTQLTSFCNINTSFMQSSNCNTIYLNNSNIKQPKNTSKVKQINSPLLQQQEQSRINKFINSNINQISNHHFNVNSLYGKDEQDLTERSIIPQLTNRGNDNTNNTLIIRDNSAKLLYNSSVEKNSSINLIKKRIEDKTKIENSSKSPTKIQKIISQLNSSKPNTIQNVPSQLAISSSQSTSCSSNQTSSTHKNYNENILSMQNDTMGSDNIHNNINSNNILSPATTRSIQINLQNNDLQSQNFNIIKNPSIIQNSEDIQQDQSQLNNIQQNQISKQDSHASQLNILLNERIQYRSEIRDSIKKPIGGSNLNTIQQISQNPNSERASSLVNPSATSNLEFLKPTTNFNSSNPINNNNNHNIKIFSKTKKKRYIISCLANIN